MKWLYGLGVFLGLKTTDYEIEFKEIVFKNSL